MDNEATRNLRLENDRLRAGLKFYARGEHYHIEEDGWESCSGEPENWLHDPGGEPNMVEIGDIAKKVLEGWTMPTEAELAKNDEAPMTPPKGYKPPPSIRHRLSGKGRVPA